MNAEEDLFEIDMSGIERILNGDPRGEVFDIAFDGIRENACVPIAIRIDTPHRHRGGRHPGDQAPRHVRGEPGVRRADEGVAQRA